MYLIVGLGNFGRKFNGTKHNVGFDIIDYLMNEYQILLSEISLKAMYGNGMIAGERVLLAKPMTYMNFSGEAVKALVDYYKINPERELVVIYDDINLKPGLIRIRKQGSAGGHNGMKNIISNLGTDSFTRIRIGIGEKQQKWDLSDYGLSPFRREIREKVNESMEKVVSALEMICQGNTDSAMTCYNNKGEKQSRKSEAV